MRSAHDRVAATPVAWGLCDVEGWGFQMDGARALGEMHGLGLRRTEYGPSSFLPTDAGAAVEVLNGFGIRAVSQGCDFAVIHEPTFDADATFGPMVSRAKALGSAVVGVAPALPDGHEGPLDAVEWERLLGNLNVLTAMARAEGLTASLHSHWGTAVLGSSDLEKVLQGSQIGMCLDTGHLLLGHVEPVQFAKDHADRVVHVHLKDVRREVIEAVQAGRLTYVEAVAEGMYVPYGTGDFDVKRLVETLESAGYSGLYVTEIEARLEGEPSPGEGPVVAVGRCVDYLVAALSS